MLVLEAASQQLKDLEQQLLASNPKLTHHLALYLQVLRDGLLGTVQQACFHLATQVHPERYCGLDLATRQLLHRRIVHLVHRANSLLSLELVVRHAGQIARDQQRQRRNQRRRVLESFTEPGSEPAPEQKPEPEPMPEGSIHLGLSLPIAAHFLTPPSDSPPAGEQAEPEDGEDDEAGQASMLQALAQAFQDWQGKAPSPGATPWDRQELPCRPDQLLAWIAGFELALSRRLRNLSHALNVDLLRLGLSRTVVPLNLLDAALSGQLDSAEAPANLLRLPLPLGMEPELGGLEAMAVLLRPADLEQALPKLRTCRTRIQQHVQEVRRMALHYRRIQRRVQALEAEQLWLQDINPAPPAPIPPP